MRTYPIDSTRVQMISTGTCAPVVQWVEIDGGRRPHPNGLQDVDPLTNLPLWRVEVIIPGDETDDRDRTAVTEITIAAKDKPDAGAFGDLLMFEGLAMSPGFLNKKTNTVGAPRWSATGIRRQHKAQQQAA